MSLLSFIFSYPLHASNSLFNIFSFHRCFLYYFFSLVLYLQPILFVSFVIHFHFFVSSLISSSTIYLQHISLSLTHSNQSVFVPFLFSSASLLLSPPALVFFLSPSPLSLNTPSLSYLSYSSFPLFPL